MIIYEGPSVLDGAPIVAILTGLDTQSDNDKTGAMLQLWIMRSDIAPHYAVTTGQDSSVCGSCVHRRGQGGDCYVIPFQAPLAVWNAYMRGNYPTMDTDELHGLQIRFGAYGDPAAIPFDALLPVLEVCDLDGSTGYTHQAWHKNFDPRVALFCQVSVDSPAQAKKAHASGFKTFRVAGNANLRFDNEIECLSDSEGLSCAECKLCNGQLQNIVISAHGSKASVVRQRDIIARA